MHTPDPADPKATPGGKPAGEQPAGRRATGGQPRGGQQSGGPASGGERSGGPATGGRTSSGPRSGGSAGGGKTPGGPRSGGPATGGKRSGGTATGGQAGGGPAGETAAGKSAGERLTDAREKLGSASKKVGHASKVGAGGVAAASKKTAAVSGKVGRATGRRIRGLTGAQGASESGLSRLIELGAVNAAGDTAFAVSLAGTVFFTVPSDQARDRVALFLVLTMAPFALMAPLIGPILDRFRHGRRWAIGATLGLRGFLVWSLAASMNGSTSNWLYPAALGCLVASKAYGVTRASAVPR
ncbi:MAG TPA: hypothetical protein VFI00_04850, partial [Kribbella sp.]|nr:hypothetical protein [Kribbella sp.]